MKRLCLLLAALLLLSGCRKAPEPPSPVTIDIYAVNDLHGKLADTDAQPGVDELTTYLKQAAQNGNTLLLSTGDMWQGSSESNLTGGLMVTEWMNHLNFAAMTLGGHEFDWGEDQIRENAQLAAFPFLAINVYDRATDQPVDYCRGSTVVEVDGVQIGVIGAIGDCYNAIAAEHTKNVYFKVGDQLTDLVRAEAEKLRSDGVDYVIYAIHDGYAENSGGSTAMAVNDEQLSGYYDVALSDGYIDLVFEADSHYTYALRDSRGVHHLQAGGNNSGISHATVVIDGSNGDTIAVTTDLLPNSKYSFLDDDPIVRQLMDKYSEQISPATEIVGTNGRYRSGDDVCQAVADLYRDKGLEKWGDRYDIVLGGGYISCRSPGYLPAGEVQYSQLQSLLPFDNPITLCSIRGRDLISRFLETDNPAYFIATTAYGDELDDYIDPDGVYYVVTDSYSADYAYNRMTVIDTYADGVYARDLLAEHIRAGEWAK